MVLTPSETAGAPSPEPVAVGPAGRTVWLAGLALLPGVGVSLAAFMAAMANSFPVQLVAWVVLTLGWGLTVAVVLHVMSSRRHAAEVRNLKEQLDREIQEHHESEETYRALIENAPDAILTLDLDCGLISTNSSCSMLTGWAANDWIGKPIWPLIHAEDLPKARTTLAAVLHGAKPPVMEFRVLKKSGEFIPMEFIVTPQFHQHRVSRMIAIGRDITSRRQSESAQNALEAQLRRTQKMEAVGRLAGGIAHEFNNFLAVIMANAELVRMDLGSSVSSTDSLDQIGNACRRGAELVRQILAFSHRRDHEERRVVNLEPIVDDAVKMLRSTLPASVSTKAQFMPGCPPVLANPGEIHQIIINLATNSAHAMRDKGGKLEISMYPMQVTEEFAVRNLDLRPGPYVCLAVADNGRGMDSTTQERIFEPFFTTKPLGEGTGLGLSVVHGIVKSYGGAISVYSELGRGTKFHIYFPAANGEELPLLSAHIENPKGHGERVLLVDDEALLANSGLRMLERLGYKTTVLTDPAEALKFFREAPASFDCIVTDQSMPGMSGVDLAAECRQLNPDIPIILMSGSSSQMCAEELRPQGIRELLAKPFTLQTLAQVLSRTLGQ